MLPKETKVTVIMFETITDVWRSVELFVCLITFYNKICAQTLTKKLTTDYVIENSVT